MDPDPTKHKRVTRTVKEKLVLIRKIEGGQRLSEVAASHNVEMSTLSTIFKNRDELKQRIIDNPALINHKRPRKCSWPEVEKTVLTFYKQNRLSDTVVTGPMLRSYALDVATKMGYRKFSASSGWLSKFTSRHNISLKKPRVESTGSDPLAASESSRSLSEEVLMLQGHDISVKIEPDIIVPVNPDVTIESLQSPLEEHMIEHEENTATNPDVSESSDEDPLVLSKYPLLPPEPVKRKRNRVTRTLREKLEMIRDIENGLKQKEVATKYNVEMSTLSTMLKSRDRLKQQALENVNLINSKRTRVSSLPELEKAVLRFYKQTQSSGKPVNGPLLRGYAKNFAARMGYRKFKGSSGWLSNFTNKHSISFKKKPAESTADVPKETSAHEPLRLEFNDICHCCLLNINRDASELGDLLTEGIFGKFEDNFPFNEQNITYAAAYLAVNACSAMDVADLGLVNICNSCKAQLESAFSFHEVCKKTVFVLRQQYSKVTEEPLITVKKEPEDFEFIPLSSTPPCEETDIKLEFEEEHYNDLNLPESSTKLESDNWKNITIHLEPDPISFDQATNKVEHPEHKTFQANIEDKTIPKDFCKDNNIENGQISSQVLKGITYDPAWNRYQCEVCPQQFKSYKCYATHKVLHKPTIIGSYKCPYCGQSFSESNQFEMHILTVHKKHSLVCAFCKNLSFVNV